MNDRARNRPQTVAAADDATSGPQMEHGHVTMDGRVMGTPAYMSPEQARGQIDQLDKRTDVFALGAILCEILTGQPPYVSDGGSSSDDSQPGDSQLSLLERARTASVAPAFVAA